MLNLSDKLPLARATSYEFNPDSMFLCILYILDQIAHPQHLDVSSLKALLGENLNLDTLENQALLLRHYMSCRKHEKWMSENKRDFEILLTLSDEEFAAASKYFTDLFHTQIVNDQMWPDLCYLPYLLRILVQKNGMNLAFLVVLVDMNYDILGTFEVGVPMTSDHVVVFQLSRDDVTLNVVSVNNYTINSFQQIATLSPSTPSLVEQIRQIMVTVDQIENICKNASELSLQAKMTPQTNGDMLGIVTKMSNMRIDKTNEKKDYVVNPLTGRKISVGGRIWLNLKNQKKLT